MLYFRFGIGCTLHVFYFSSLKIIFNYIQNFYPKYRWFICVEISPFEVNLWFISFKVKISKFIFGWHEKILFNVGLFSLFKFLKIFFESICATHHKFEFETKNLRAFIISWIKKYLEVHLLIFVLFIKKHPEFRNNKKKSL